MSTPKLVSNIQNEITEHPRTNSCNIIQRQRLNKSFLQEEITLVLFKNRSFVQFTVTKNLHTMNIE